MWGERYRLLASERSSGGHRRYTPDDVERLVRMHQAVLSGDTPAAAAAAALGVPEQATDPRRPGGPGGSVLAVPRGTAAARGLARAASRLDEMAVEDAVVEAMQHQGVLAAWNEIVRPVLVAAGDHWQRTGDGIEIEHLLTQAVATACVRYASTLPDPARDRPVLLAGGPSEEHILPLHALRAALAERGVPARLLGPRTPMAALAGAARRIRSAGALVWLSRPDPDAAPGLTDVRAAHRRMVVLVGGPGWTGVDVSPALACDSPQQAADLLAAAWQGL
jgi:DNA-binding transcriptional MerR regulator